MPDYREIIDNDTWAFIQETEAYYPPDAVGLSLTEQREVYDRMCAAFRAERPCGLVISDLTVAGIACRSYGTGAVTVLYAHGGGFVVGGLNSHDDVCSEFAAATGARVVSVDYRLAPEHPHPAAYDDVLAVAHALEGPLVLAGDSAGGALVASVAHALRGRPSLQGLLLIYPSLGGDHHVGSYVTHAHAPMLTTADVRWYAATRHGGAEPALPDATAGALYDRDFSGLPRVVAASAECDPLADDGRNYVDLIQAAGGQAEWLLDSGLVHGWLRARHRVPRARAAFERLCQKLSDLTQP